MKKIIELALQALELSSVTVDNFKAQKKTQEAIAALKEALEKEALHKLAGESLTEGLCLGDWDKIGCVNHDCDKCKAQQSAELNKPFLWAATIDIDSLGDCDDFCRNFRTEQCEGFKIPICTFPAAREPMTDYQASAIMEKESWGPDATTLNASLLRTIRRTEAHHGITKV